MTAEKSVDLTPLQAANLIGSELSQAENALEARKFDAAIDGYIRALGLALQLGPAPTEQVLDGVLHAARILVLSVNSGASRSAEMSGSMDDRNTVSSSLAALGPAIVALVTQVRNADALPATGVMEAWATVASDLGALIGQVGLALDIAANHRSGMMDNAIARAKILDEATGNRFALGAWVEAMRA
jgi:hypothetical protein